MSSSTADATAQAPDRSRAGLARLLFAVSIGSTGIGLTLWLMAWRASGADAIRPNTGDVVYLLVSLMFSVVGVLIASRRPENSLGWLLLGIGVANGLSYVGSGYAEWAIYAATGAPFGAAMAALMGWTWIPGIALPATFLPLLFPNGHLPSPRWRWFAWMLAIGMIAASIGIVFTSGELEGFPMIDNPIAVPALEVLSIGLLTLPVGVIGAVLSLVVRFRRAQADERQQIRWVAAAVVVMGVTYTAALLATWSTVSGWDGGSDAPGWIQVLQTASLASFALIPLAMGLAILRYHLYDLGFVIRKTLIFAVMAAVIAVVYVGLVVGVGALVGARGSPLLSALAAAVVALVFQPVRTRARRLADRIVFGARSTPYEVMAQFRDQLAGTYSADDVLERTARVLGEGVGAERADVRLAVGDEMRPVATWPPDAPEGRDALVAEVRHQGELLGALAVSMPASDPIDPPREQLVRDLASQAGLVLRNERLTGQLRTRLVELKAAQKRLVAAQDEERRRLERNIHDGAQQQLVALAVKARLARNLTERDPGKVADMLTQIETETQEALEDLRDLARGIYPPLLADRGLAVALEAQARKSPVPVTIEVDGVDRLPQEIEAAVYFSVLEGLQNTAKYADATQASVTLERADGELRFSVRDDGRGFDPTSVGFGTGLQGIADRLGALDGAVEITSAPGRGTAVAGSIRLAEAEA